MSLEEVELMPDENTPSAAPTSNLLSRNQQPWEILSFSQGKWFQEFLILQGWPQGCKFSLMLQLFTAYAAPNPEMLQEFQLFD